LHMLPRRHSRPAIGSGVDVVACHRPVFLPSHLRAEWDAVCQGQHNFLLVGTPPATNEMLVAMTPHLPEPLQKYSAKAGLPVPQPSDGTLILLEVAKLDAKRQTELLRWLNRFDQRSHVQIVSTTSKPLFSLVERGVFLADLYYKLNVVRIDLIGSGSAGRHARLPLD
jgi:hypothetical protein